MKAIETIYNGYRFRSRLEAKWAVFFDALGIPYEYEKEGYDLDGTHYLPDFWLPVQQRWIEIKGQEPTAEELRKVDLLECGTGYPSCLFWGLPGDNFGWAFFTCAHPGGAGKSFWEYAKWRECLICENIDVDIKHGDECTLYSEVDDVELNRSCFCLEDDIQKYILQPYEMDTPDTPEQQEWHEAALAKLGKDKYDEQDRKFKVALMLGYVASSYNSPRLIAAYTIARQARFEHGEKGRRNV